jgi:hypothetical protein
MTQFLKLSSVIINTRYINRIHIEPFTYSIHLIDNYTGSIFGSAFFISGDVSSEKVIKIKAEQEKDYKIVTDWLKL